MTKDILLKELIIKQRKNINLDNKFQYSDFIRLLKYINSSIFDPNTCSLWNGHVIERIQKDNNEYNYINFYFKKKKVMLHRILYINFVDNLNEGEYIKFVCENKGKCCNINHIKKIENSRRNERKNNNINENLIEKNEINEINTNSEELIIDFE
jgi:hypothetical protein